MNLLKQKIVHKPLGIWIALLVLVSFLFLPLLFSHAFFPHAWEFLQRGFFHQVLLTPGVPSFLVGIPFTAKAIFGILNRRSWSIFDAQGAFALMIASLLAAYPFFGAKVFLLLIVIFLAMWGLLLNRRWFDDYL